MGFESFMLFSDQLAKILPNIFEMRKCNSNIHDDELEALQEIAAELHARTGQQLDNAVADGLLEEIYHDDED